MQITPIFPRAEEILLSFSSPLGDDFLAYRNHVFRVLNYFLVLAKPSDVLPEAVLIAAAFHDLGIWTDHTFDYLKPSVRQARTYLSDQNLEHLDAEIEAIITQHHKLRPYTGRFAFNVETFRKADLVDVSLGAIRFGLPFSFVRSVKAAFPNEGFHWRLTALTARQFLRNPLRPLPMVHW